MKKVKNLFATCLVFSSLVGCGGNVIADEGLAKLSAIELATLYCAAMKDTNLEQLKVLVGNEKDWNEFRSIYFANDKEIAKHKAKAEKYNCEVVQAKESKKHTKIYFKKFKNVYVYKENGINTLKLI
ncbi:hypothetical protein EXT47_05225 [Pseudoalteromonas sp. CO342X]|uniref:hypothetical protein n=1 Tax=Pseudoalteromonas sp. CO342X TaxID=1777270 RepID=UPI0010230952|nr:hypothetical protein [Pseudoalteromonas sp. CO342X]RZG16730.1 hypothetical protein EXT47_05225 [Pseudoalteromonas sp. CO342X]